jgi:hypothetical protein
MTDDDIVNREQHVGGIFRKVMPLAVPGKTAIAHTRFDGKRIVVECVVANERIFFTVDAGLFGDPTLPSASARSTMTVLRSRSSTPSGTN